MEHINWINPDIKLYAFLVDLWSRDLSYEDAKMYVGNVFNKELVEKEWELFDSLLFAQYERDMGEVEWTEQKL